MKTALADKLNPFGKDFFCRARILPLPGWLLVFAGALYGFAALWRLPLAAEAATLWLWGWALFLPYFARLPAEDLKQSGGVSKITGWAGLALAGFCAGQGAAQASFLFLAWAFASFFVSAKFGRVCAAPFALWWVAVPHIDDIHFLLSEPLRILAANLTAWILAAAGMDVRASGALIFLNGKEIAITTACSGIEQFEAMLLMGWIFVLFLHRKTSTRLLHFVLILPLILGVNALRLVITLAGGQYRPDLFFSEAAHVALGWLSVLAIGLLFLILGGLFAAPEKGKECA